MSDKMICNYEVISNYDLEEVIKDVKNGLSKNWTLESGIVCARDGTGHILYLQTMVYYDY